MHRTALLAGATGLVGRALLSLLLDDTDITQVWALARRPLATPHPKLLQGIVPSFSKLDRFALPNVDDFYCCLGTTIKQAGSEEAFREVDLTFPMTIARMAIEVGASRCLFVSSMGASAESRVLYNRTKGELEDELSRLPFQAVYAFRPSLLAGQRDEFRFGERIAIAIARPLAFMIPPRLRPIAADDVARAMQVCGKQETAGRFVIQSDEIRHIAKAGYPTRRAL